MSADGADGEPLRAPPVDDAALAEQLAYYRARAPEYDEWFLRLGRYDRGDAATAAWREELGAVRGWLAELELDGADVLELAPGTGLWTRELVALGARVTAVDAAPEMLAELARRDLGPRLEVLEADLFSWRPPRRFDAVVACFFMSHVPDERFDAFCGLLAEAARPRGAVFLLDSLRVDTSTASDHVLPEPTSQTMRRRLDDGRGFQVVKRFRDDADVVAACARAGITATARRTLTYFQVVAGERRIREA